jgi:hypothetical protein
VDKVNSQMAARLAVTLADGDTWDEDRQALMSAQLRRMGGHPGASADLRATVAQALAEGCC